jgi:hypothetical protein
VYVSAGPRYTSTLVHDSIVRPFDIRPGTSPALALTVEFPQARGWTAGVRLDVSWSQLRRYDEQGDADLGGLGMLAATVGLRRTLAPRVSAGLRAGALRYQPAREDGVFASGTGGLVPLVGLAATFAGATPRSLGLELGYDLHRFITPALRERGYQDARVVHRLTLALRARINSR